MRALRWAIGFVLLTAFMVPGTARAHGGGSWSAVFTATPPTLDGTLNSGEWGSAPAYSLTFGTHSGTVRFLRDNNYLYVGLIVQDSAAGSNAVGDVYFDNAHNGTKDLGDDVWLGGIGGQDFFFCPAPTCSSTSHWNDTSNGGTNDTTAASTFNGNAFSTEIRHPLCSPDGAHDVCISTPGQVVGVDVRYDNGTGSFWDAPGADTFTTANGWADLTVPGGQPVYSCTGGATTIVDNWNVAAVSNGGTPHTFRTFGPWCVSQIATYHYNGGAGDAGPGTIGLKILSGAGGPASSMLGPWPIVASAGTTANNNWTATPPASPPLVVDGSYQCIDSQPSSWSQNSQSFGEGFCRVFGQRAQLVSGPDVIPPDVNVTAPAAGTSISGIVTVSADAIDDAAVQSVHFQYYDPTTGYVDLGTDTTAPYTATFDSRTVRNVGPGASTVYATATDTAGHTTTVGNGVGVSNPEEIDQQNTSAPTGIGAADGAFGQSFTVGGDGYLTQVAVAVGCTFGGSSATLKVYAGDWDYLSGPLPAPLASQPVTISGPGCTTSPAINNTYRLNTPLRVRPGEKYTFLITGQGQTDAPGSTADPYPGGDFFGAPSGWDLVFATYIDRISAPETPQIDAGLGPNAFVCLSGWGHGVTVHVSLNGAALFDAMTDASGSACTNPPGLQLHPGDVLHGDDGVATDTLTLANVSVDSVDSSANTASGHAPPGKAVEVRVFPFGSGGTPLHQYATVTADGAGVWSVGDGFDLARGQSVDALTRDASNNATHAHFDLPSPSIYASLSNDMIGLFNWAPGSPVTVAVGPITRSVTPDAGGTAWLFSQDLGRALNPGDVITATQGSDSKSLTLQGITVDTVDPSTGTVTGRAPAGVQVNVGESDGSTFVGNTPVVASSGGTYSAVVPVHPLPAQWHINSTISDGDGDQSVADAQVPTVHASINTDFVNTWGWPNGIPLTATIDGGAPIHLTTGAQGSWGTATVNNPGDIHPGTTIDVTGSAWGLTITKHLVVAGVTIDSVDPVAHTLSGTAPANATVQVHGSGITPGPGLTTVADGTGHWTITLPASAFAGAWTIDANVPDADGDLSAWHAQIPKFQANLTSGGIGSSGGWPANDHLAVIVGSASTSVVTNARGDFFVTSPAALTPGTSVEVKDATFDKTLTVANLTFTSLDPATDTASGNAPSGPVQVCLNQGATFLGCKSTTSNGDSPWTVDFTGVATITTGTHATAQFADADGDATTAERTVAPVATLDSTPPNPDTSDGSTFQFSSSTPGASFRCQVDGHGYQPCTSPKLVYVANGSHTFDVEAGIGGTFGAPASFTWTANVAPPPADTLRVDVTQPVGSLDPAAAQTANTWQILKASCDTLYTESTTSPPAIQPLAATGPPATTGATTTITVRSGLQFANGEPVTAQSYADEINRLLDPTFNPANAYLADNIVSATASGQVLTITASKSNGSLPSRLSMPAFCPVPSGTPHTAVASVSGSGPFTVASVDANGITMDANPAYGGTRTSAFSHIHFDVGVDPATGEARTLAGVSDYELGGPPLADLPAIADGHASQLFENPNMIFWYVGMNVARPPFGNPSLRRAIAYALNRSAIATQASAARLSVATDHLLPPGMPGYRPTSFYPLSGDLATALSLAAAAGVSPSSPITASFYTCTNLFCTKTANQIAHDLAQIGVILDIRQFPRGQQIALEQNPTTPDDLFFEGWSSDFPDPSNTFAPLFAGAGGANFTHYAGADAQIAAADAAPFDTRFDQFANVEQSIATGDAPAAAVLNQETVDLFSPRIACRQYDPVTGMDIAALCVSYMPSLTFSADATSVAAGAASTSESSIPPSALSGAPSSTTQAAPLEPIPLEPIPLEPIVIAGSPLEPITLDRLGFTAASLQNSTLGGLPLTEIPLKPPLTWQGELAGTVLANVPLQTLTLANVIQSAPSVLAGVHLGDLNLAASSIGQLSLAAAALGPLPLEPIPINGHTGTQNDTDWCNLIRSIPGFATYDCSQIATQTLMGLSLQGVPLEPIPLEPIPLEPIDLSNTPLEPIPLEPIMLGHSAIGSVKLSEIDLSVSPFGAIALSALPTAHVCLPGVACTGTVASAFTAGLLDRNATVADLGAYPGVRLGNIGKGLPLRITINDLLALLLPAAAYDWNTLPSDFPLQDFATDGGRVHYSAAFRLDGRGPATGAKVSVALTNGERYQPGSTSISPPEGVAAPVGGEPTATDSGGTETVVWKLKNVMPNATFTLHFTARAGTTLGGGTASATIAATASPSATAPPAPLSVTDTFEPNGTADQAPTVSTNTLYTSYITAAGDTDLFRYPIPSAGTQVKIFLQRLPADYDLVVYGPQSQPLRSAPLEPIPLEPIAPSDPVPGLQPQTQGISTETLQDVPINPPSGQTVVGASNARGTAEEEVDFVSTGQSGNLTIQVSGFNGASSELPYLLRIEATPPPALPPCQPRTMGSGGTAGTMPAIAGNVNTLFLVNEKQIGDLYGATAEANVISALNTTIANGYNGVVGAIVPVESDPATANAYAAWNANPCSPALANDVVRSIGSLLDGISSGRPIQNVVIVGSDEVVPMGREVDPNPLANEAEYASTLGYATNNEFISALVNHFVLTDDAYGGHYNGQVYVPTVGVSRVVETPTEIIGQFNQYNSAHGQLAPTTALWTGYDFLSDGTHAAAQASRDQGKTVNELNDDTWTRDQLLAAMFPSTGAPAIMGLNGHYDQYRMLPADQNAARRQDVLFTTQQLISRGSSATQLRNVLTIGCHSGYSAPDTIFGTANALSLDWPQAYAQTGAASFVGGTGFGLGDTVAVAYSEKLQVYLSRRMDGSLNVGRAAAFAKQDYFGSIAPALFSGYDKKAMEESTTYGVGLYSLGTLPPPAPPTPLPTFTDGPTGLTAATVSLTPSFHANPTANGTYYDVAGNTVNESRRPIEPVVTADVTQPGLVAHDPLITSLGNLTDVSPFDPAFSTIGIDSTSAQPELVGLTNYPTIYAGIRSITTPTGRQQRLVFVPGEYRSDGIPDQKGVGAQVLYGSASITVLYSNSANFTRPQLGPVTEARVGGNLVAFSFDVTSAAPVKRVLILYRDGAIVRSLDAGCANGHCSGAGPLGSSTTEYYVQVVDANGNVGVSHDKGSIQPPTQQTTSGHVTATVTGPANGSWYTGAASVTFSAPAGVSVEYRVDGGVLTAYTGTAVPVAGDGVHALSYDASDGSTGNLVIPIDTRGPTISTTFHVYMIGSTGNTFDVTCSDAGSGIASCATTPAAPDTSSVGIKSFSVHATDRVGNGADATGSYQVVWPFRGFLSPVSNVPTLNQATAGQAVPVKFSLSGNRGLAILAAGSPSSAQVACDTSAPLGSVVPTTTSGSSSLAYDATTDTYSYVWKTDKTWAGTCRQLDVKLADGTDHFANFKFK